MDSSQTDISLIKDIACNVDGVIECHKIRTRGTKGQIFVDLHMLVNPALSVEEAHAIAEKAEKVIKERLPEVADVVVHIEPSK